MEFCPAIANYLAFQLANEAPRIPFCGKMVGMVLLREHGEVAALAAQQAFLHRLGKEKNDEGVKERGNPQTLWTQCRAPGQFTNAGARNTDHLVTLLPPPLEPRELCFKMLEYKSLGPPALSFGPQKQKDLGHFEKVIFIGNVHVYDGGLWALVRLYECYVQLSLPIRS